MTPMKKSNKNPVEDRLITRVSTSSRWGDKSIRTLKRMEQRGQLTPVQIGGRVHYRLSEILKFEEDATATMTTGDYSIAGFEDTWVVERKIVGDLIGSLTGGSKQLTPVTKTITNSNKMISLKEATAGADAVLVNPSPHEWWVVSTILAQTWLVLHCDKTGKTGKTGMVHD
ncbi:MAG: hypothetical protein P8J87_03245, partial [Verrucomicrobiales bacterium]|nr:hypothetical protein [Verrucomicrobiales bacterium]